MSEAEKAQRLLDAARLQAIPGWNEQSLQGWLNEEDAATFDELAASLGDAGIGLGHGENDGEIILLS